MSGKLNWERVRKESLAREHGSAWVGSGFPKARKRRKKKAKKAKAKKTRTKTRLLDPTTNVGQWLQAKPHLSLGMEGCSCGKPKGFAGEHKKTCLWSEKKPPTTGPGTIRMPLNSLPPGTTSKSPDPVRGMRVPAVASRAAERPTVGRPMSETRSSLVRHEPVNRALRHRSMTLAEFATELKKAGHGERFRKMFRLEMEILNQDARLSLQHKEAARKAVQAMLDAFALTML